MFVYNINMNRKGAVKTVFAIICVIIVLFFVIATYKIVTQSFKVKDQVNQNNVQYLTTKDYTDVLKSVHEDLSTYVGKRINFTGYVYRLSDFKPNEFVLARDMMVTPNANPLIVGFLCDYGKAKDFTNNTWVEVTGEITKGDYHGDIPIIKVTDIKTVDKPSDDLYADPPDDTYVPTSAMF